ncbi:MAG: hypothetical protein ABIN36_15945 [Ferruginibacter sp.]
MSFYQRKRYGALLFGIIIFLAGLWYLPVLLTFHFQLTKITGTLRTGKVYISTVESTRWRYFKHTSKSQKSELIFFLNEYNKKFSLIGNIGDNYQNIKFDEILDNLKYADSVSVWIKKSEKKYYQPKIFQIDADKNTLLDLESVRTEHSYIAVFLLGLGILMVLLFYWTRKEGPLTNTRKYL